MESTDGKTYGAIVAGAGPAVCSAALFIANAGNAVLLPDKSHFPREMGLVREKNCIPCIGYEKSCRTDCRACASHYCTIRFPICAFHCKTFPKVKANINSFLKKGAICASKAVRKKRNSLERSGRLRKAGMCWELGSGGSGYFSSTTRTLKRPAGAGSS